MRITTYIKSLAAAGMAILLLSGCSEGTTATGLGLGVSGSWSGSLKRNGSAFTNFTMSLVQVGADSEDPFGPSTLEGTFNSNDKCVGGGPISGSLNANDINITVDGANGTLNMSGTAGNSSMSGSWSNQGEITGDDENDENVSCNFSGTWTANR